MFSKILSDPELVNYERKMKPDFYRKAKNTFKNHIAMLPF